MVAFHVESKKPVEMHAGICVLIVQHRLARTNASVCAFILQNMLAYASQPMLSHYSLHQNESENHYMLAVDRIC